jgi:hypothetical protein
MSILALANKWREPGLGADYLMHKVAMSRVD